MNLNKSFISGIICTVVSVTLLIVMGLATADDKKPSYMKDLHVLQIPMAELESSAEKREVADADVKKQLAVKVAVDSSDRTYKHGDKLKLSVETTQDAYVWVFDTGTSGKVHQIFPNKHETDNFVRAGMFKVPKPGADYDFIVSHPQGTELITVIASKDGHPLTENLISESVGSAFFPLDGNAASVAKDISVSLRKKHREWNMDQQIVFVK